MSTVTLPKQTVWVTVLTRDAWSRVPRPTAQVHATDDITSLCHLNTSGVFLRVGFRDMPGPDFALFARCLCVVVKG